MRIICAAGLVIAVTLPATPLRANAPVSVAVLGLEATGGAPLDAAARFAAALKNRVLRTPGYKLVQGKNLDEVKLVFGCVDEQPDCMARVGGSLQADKLLWGAIKRAGSGFTVTLQFLDVKSSKVEKFVTEPISQEEGNQPDAAVERLTRSFLLSADGMVELRSSVAGAKVLLGTKVKGVTDGASMMLDGVPAGSYLLQLQRDGYRPWVRRIVVEPGRTTEVTAELESLRESVVSPPPPVPLVRAGEKRTGWKIAFWTGAALTVGIGAGIVGAGLTVRDLESQKNETIKRVLSGSGAQLSADVKQQLQSSDACAVEGAGPAATEVKNLCDRGKTWATVVNALLGAGIITASVTSFFLYKAYIAESRRRYDTDDEEETASSQPSRWRILTGVAPGGASVGLSVDF